MRVLHAVLLCSISAGAQTIDLTNRLFGASSLQLVKEQRHYALSTSRQFEEMMWVNYRGKLYYWPNTTDAREISRAIAEARKRYVVFTNKAERIEMRKNWLVESGISDDYLAQFTTPNDPTNSLPVLHDKETLYLSPYKLVQC